MSEHYNKPFMSSDTRPDYEGASGLDLSEPDKIMYTLRKHHVEMTLDEIHIETGIARGLCISWLNLLCNQEKVTIALTPHAKVFKSNM